MQWASQEFKVKDKNFKIQRHVLTDSPVILSWLIYKVSLGSRINIQYKNAYCDNKMTAVFNAAFVCKLLAF